MINKKQLAAWAEKTLNTYTLDVVDLKNDRVTIYNAKGDHDYQEVADIICADKDCYIHIRDVNTVIGGFGISCQPRSNHKNDVPVIEIDTYSDSIKHLITDLIPAED